MALQAALEAVDGSGGGSDCESPAASCGKMSLPQLLKGLSAFTSDRRTGRTEVGP